MTKYLLVPIAWNISNSFISLSKCFSQPVSIALSLSNYIIHHQDYTYSVQHAWHHPLLTHSYHALFNIISLECSSSYLHRTSERRGDLIHSTRRHQYPPPQIYLMNFYYYYYYLSPSVMFSFVSFLFSSSFPFSFLHDIVWRWWDVIGTSI